MRDHVLGVETLGQIEAVSIFTGALSSLFAPPFRNVSHGLAMFAQPRNAIRCQVNLAARFDVRQGQAEAHHSGDAIGSARTRLGICVAWEGGGGSRFYSKLYHSHPLSIVISHQDFYYTLSRLS